MIKKIFRKLRNGGMFSLAKATLKYLLNFKKRNIYKKMLIKENIEDRFNEIYQHNLWSSNESLSGTGSELVNTLKLRNWLHANISKLKIRSLVDAPCGDFNWMKLVLPTIEINYLGLDIVHSVIEKNNSQYSNNKIKFKKSNICEDRIPNGDLIMVRDFLFHLSFYDIDNFLKNLQQTNYKYLLTSTHMVGEDFKNYNITSGDFRKIDIFKKPFNFNLDFVMDRILDFGESQSTKKEMILIEKKNVPTELSFL